MEEDSATVVLLHAPGQDTGCWQFLELGDLGMTDAGLYEMPGHGTRPRRPRLTWESMADEVATQFTGPLHLASVGSASAIALSMLVRYPERIRSAVIVCGGGFVTAAASPAARKESAEQARMAVTKGMASIVDETLSRWFTPDGLLRNVPGVQYARLALLTLDPRAWSDAQLAALMDSPIPTGRLGQVKQPVTLVGVFHDAGEGIATATQLHLRIPNSRVQYTAGPAMLHLERPRNLLCAVEQHFIWIRTGARRIEEPLNFAGE